MRRSAALIAAIVATGLSLTTGTGVQAQPPIRIGASLSQTGAYAALGQNQLRGYQLCVKHTNDKGGVLGRKLELVLYDNDSDPAMLRASVSADSESIVMVSRSRTRLCY